MPNNYYESTFGTRICLGGEGMGLYGGMALTIPVSSLYTSVLVTAKEGSQMSIESGQENERELEIVVRSVCKALMDRGCKLSGFSVRVKSNIPSGYGLASSATLYAGVTKSVAGLSGYKLSLNELGCAAYEAEHVINGVLVGKTDTNAILYRHALLHDYGNKDRSRSLRKLRTLLPSNTAVVLAGGTPSSYANMGKSISEQYLTGESKVAKYFKDVRTFVPLLAEGWQHDDRTSISQNIEKLFRSVCENLASENDTYQELANTAISHGAFAAKNVGLRPCGGCIFALCDLQTLERVHDALRSVAQFTHVVREADIF